jgi:hypothetical protein
MRYQSPWTLAGFVTFQADPFLAIPGPTMVVGRIAGMSRLAVLSSADSLGVHGLVILVNRGLVRLMRGVHDDNRIPDDCLDLVLGVIGIVMVVHYPLLR